MSGARGRRLQRRREVGGRAPWVVTAVPLEADRSSNKGIDRFLEVLSVSHTVMATQKARKVARQFGAPKDGELQLGRLFVETHALGNRHKS